MIIGYQNVRGLNTKLVNLFANSYSFHYHVIIFTETWLKDNIFDTEILCARYQIYRKNRNQRNGGGVLIAVLSTIPSEVLISNISDIEFISVLIKFKTKKYFITCSYIPPNSPQPVYSQHLQCIKSVVESADPLDSVFVVGDFNLPSILWNFLPDTTYLLPIKSNSWTDEFLNEISDLCLFQVNNILNSNGNLLDLVFVNEPTDYTIERAYPISNPEDRYHPTINFSCPFPSAFNPDTNNNKPLKKVYTFKYSNYTTLNNLIRNTNWNLLLSSTTNSHHLDQLVERFYSTIYSFFEECVPKRTIFKPSGPPWSTKELSRLKNLKNKFYKKYKKTGSLTDYGSYSICRADYNLLNMHLYNNYLTEMKYNFKRDPKMFYNFVNSKRRSVEYPSVMKFNGRESNEDDVICDMFADFFASTYSELKYDTSIKYPFPLPSTQSITFSLLDHSLVKLRMKKLKSSFKPGADGVPSCILVKCAETLAVPLTIIFNLSIKYGYFPALWRKSFITPLYKSGSRSDVNNYRGIAKLSPIPKLLETFITDSICHQTASIISPYQHGFRKGLSTVTNLLELTTLINRGFTENKQTDVVYTDFSKAFDKVSHLLLLIKLELLGFSPSSINWLRSYLMGRMQSVQFKNSTSKNIHVHSGVPQGSHLGPLLFTLFINDLPSIIKFCYILMYADDVKIFVTYNLPSVADLMQSDLNNFYWWCEVNLMQLNLKKCKCMKFYRKNVISTDYYFDGHKLELVDLFLDLGVLFDPKLNFISHINVSVNKARGVLAFIKRWAKEFTDPYVTKQLYMSLVRPILEYGSIIWDPQYNVHINNIESVQKQFLIFCLRGLPWSSSFNLPSYSSRLALIKLPTLQSRRTMLNVSFLFNLINGVVNSTFLLQNILFNVPQRPTRNFQPLSIQYFRQNFANADPFRRICNQFNDLSALFDFCSNVDSVKRNIIIHLNQ